MKFPEKYKVLNQNSFSNDEYSIVPIRYEDRFKIMEWRNEQMYHCRQSSLLTKVDQENYFKNVIAILFDKDKPEQILFSYLKDGEFIGYGGLVHINWIDRNAEISFLIKTELEKNEFKIHWGIYLQLLEQLAIKELNLHKIYTYAFDLRPHLYEVLEQSSYIKEAILKEHCLFDAGYIDVVIHSKIFRDIKLRTATKIDLKIIFDWANDSDVRKNAFNMESITWEDHVNWFNKGLNSSNFLIFILEHNDIPIGQIRFEKEDVFWKMDYSIRSESRGLGMGKKIVEMGIEKISGKIKAWVKKENIASCKVFEKLGFEKISSTDNVILYALSN